MQHDPQIQERPVQPYLAVRRGLTDGDRSAADTAAHFIPEEARPMPRHRTATRDDWLVARRDLLEKEKELTRRSDELARERLELPWVALEKEYRFETPEGPGVPAEELLPLVYGAGGLWAFIRARGSMTRTERSRPR